MPLWSIHHSPGLYTAEDKRNFANDVTGIYTRIGLPPFYVVVAFHEVDPENLFVGGESTDAAVRVVIEHIARHTEAPEDRRRIGDTITRVVAPYTTDRGLHTEFHVDETPRDLWMINGMWPPPAGSDGEKLWAEENATVPY
ncbi:tautomerase family protein [Actinomycetospora atypica]|uniref:Tautomerase family protein n=1 Tax=Actinomycetospora atypica TaxID=1290095 RepID=A0ABV9YU01_9PSEU